MKKALITILALTLAFSAVACGGKKDDKENGTTAATTEAVTTEAVADEGTDAPAGDAAGSLAILETVWNAMPEDSKFYCVGGNMTAGTAVEGAPADFGVDSAEDVDNSLGFPAASISMIDEAANLIHGMNANNFTMAAYHLTNAADADAAVKAIEENLANRQWMCGFPEVLKVVTVSGEYIVSVFGAAEIIDPVMAQLTASYPDAVVALDKSLME